MENRLFSYKSFLVENSQDKSFQMEEFERCREMGIVKYSGKYDWNPEINGLDFDQDLTITQKFKDKSLSTLPFKIGDIGGNFDCSGSDNLQDLTGSPRSCFDFDASYCSLSSLYGAPDVVNSFNVESNLLTNIKSAPRYIFGKFDLRDNMISGLNFGPYLVQGEIMLLGNRRVMSEKLGKLYGDMHREIRSIYIRDGYLIEDKVVNEIERDILKKDFPFNALIKNPEYAKFLGEFKKDIEEWEDILKRGKDFGLI
jgi:hypothetical protein